MVTLARQKRKADTRQRVPAFDVAFAVGQSSAGDSPSET